MKKETLERLKKATEEYVNDNKVTATSIRKKYHLHHNTFYNYLKSQNIEIRNNHEYSMKKIKLAEKEYIEGEESNLVGLCDKFHISDEEFSKYLKSKGILIRKHRIYHIDESYYDIIDTEEKAYSLGFIVADGGIIKISNKNIRKYNIEIHLGRKDKKHLEKIAKIFNVPIIDTKYRNKKRKKTYYFSTLILCSKKMVNSLIEKGIKPRKSLKLTDEVFKYIPKHLLHHFIRGFFDGDGCVCKDKYNRYHISFCGTKKFLKYIKYIFERKLKLGKKKISKHINIFQLHYNNNFQLIKVREWLYKDATIFLERKKEIFDTIKNKQHYNGISWSKRYKKWTARISINHKRIFLGYFKTKIQAAKAYNKAAKKYNFPEYKLNVIM